MNAPLDLRALRSFVAVAEHRNFGRAAVALEIAQPSLSLQIQRLERSLGVALFRRSSRLVELTDAGRALLAEARGVLAQAQTAVDTARLAGRGEIGTLTLGFYDSAPLIIVPVLLRRFWTRYPNVRLQLTEQSTRQQLDALARGAIDVGIMRGPVWEDGIDSACVADEQLLVALPDTHPLAARTTVPLGALKNEPFVLIPRAKGSGLYDEIIILCHNHGFSPMVVQEANETNTVCGLVAAGMGISIVPSSVRALHVRGIVYRPVSPRANIQRCVAWPAASRSPALRAFIEMLPDTPIAV